MKSLSDVSDFHGHMCPGLAYGYRVSLLALKEFDERARDEELVAIVENDSCAVDAVQVMTGCTFGKGNLVFRDYGKQVYTFISRPSGLSLKVYVKGISLPESEDEKEAWDKYMRGDRTPEIMEAVHARKSKKIQAIMDAPDSDVFEVTRDKVDAPPEAGIYPSVACTMCGEKTMEPRARIRNERIICMPCFEKKYIVM
jgi:formylmethanofuran dehydrogenase subunit E